MRFLEDLAKQAGLDPQFVAIDQIGLNADGRFVDDENWLIQAMFKLYPWEQMLRDDYAEPLPTCRDHGAGAGLEVAAVQQGHPAAAVGTACRAIPTCWKPISRATRPTTKLGDAYVRKPLFSREGANVSIVEGEAREEGQDQGYDGAAIRPGRACPAACSTVSM